MMTERNAAFIDFQSEYGRMCVMVARAINQGHAETRVAAAACGQGTSVLPVYEELRSQRARLDLRANRCTRAGVTLTELVKIGTRARDAVEGEWMLSLPVFAGVPDA